MTNPFTAVMLGAGNRGMTYGSYALKNRDKLKFIAIAEPIKTRREKFAKLHKVPSQMCFEDWEDLLSEEKLADIIFVCTQDQLHVEPTIQALEKGYDVLLEKPMAHTIDGCMNIVKKVEETGRFLGVAHVLRYTPFFSKIYDVVRCGDLGEIVNITWRENLAWYHQAHSFVRGNWSNIEKSSPMILAKCCHDFDLLVGIVGSFPKRISSFGSLTNFKPEKAPKGAPKYCVEGCPIESECNYFAPRIYVDIVPIIQIVEKSENRLFKLFIKLKKNHKKLLSGLSKVIPPLKRLRYWQDWPVDALYVGQKEDYTDEAKLNILKTSPYGKCVYFCENNVVDHQTVNIEFNNGVAANLTMHGFSHKEGRTLRIDGTKASLIGEFCDSGEKIFLCDHYSGKEQVIFKEKLSMETASHGGGDFLLIDAFIGSISDENKKQPLTNARESLESHLMAFAAHKSRLNSTIIDMEQFRKNNDYL